MRLFRLVPLLIVVHLASCSEPQCRPNEIKVGANCQKVREGDEKDSGPADGAVDDPTGEKRSDASTGTGAQNDATADTSDVSDESDASGLDASEPDADGVSNRDAAPMSEQEASTRPERDAGMMMLNECTLKKGKPCTAGEGDCQGTGVWECDDSKPDSQRCTAVEKQKNACGVTCGPLTEDCNTPGDDNCNGMANEGCCVPSAEICDGKDNDCDNQADEGGVCFCGDGIVSAGESCDPRAPEWNAWSCSTKCEKQTAYRPCTEHTDCSLERGELCISFGVCAPPCTLTGVAGGATGCPVAPPGLIALCWGREGDGRCIASGCSFAVKDCDVGQQCVGSGTTAFCVGCDESAPCPAPMQCIKGENRPFGACQ